MKCRLLATLLFCLEVLISFCVVGMRWVELEGASTIYEYDMEYGKGHADDDDDDGWLLRITNLSMHI